MKKSKNVLSILLTVLLLLSFVTLPASAADKIKYNVNRIEVTTYQELMTALATKSDETDPADLYVVLQNDISEEWDGYTDIIITYPGNVTLDMNSYDISMTSPNGDSMFFLKGENPTNFSIINTGALVNSRISFESDSYGSALILSQNPNANLNLIGEYTKYDTEYTDTNAVWNYDVKFFTDTISDTDSYPHYTVYLSKINKAYITGVELKNFAKQPVNLYVGEAKDLLITGKSALVHYGWGRIGANLILDSEYANTYNLYNILGSCYIQGDWKTATDYQSIRVRGKSSFDWKWLLYDTSGTPSGSTQMPDNTTVYNSDAIADSKRAVNTYRDIFVRRSCCEKEYPSTQTDVTMLGHVTKCLDCGSTPSYKLHNFTLKSRRTFSTCKLQGQSAYYVCSVEGCTYCQGGELLPLDPDRHISSDLVTLKAVAATCTESGLTEGKFCKGCGKTTIAQEKVDALGHNFGDWTVTKEATCTEDGSKEHTCLTCGAVETQKIDATGHSYGSYETTKEATCTEAGKQTRTCKNCGKTTSKTIKALGHDYSTEWTIDTAAGCTTAGSKSHHCTRCDAKTDVTEIAKTGHSYGSYKTTKEATCTEDGKQTRTCKNCGKTTSKTIAATGHDYGSYKTTKKATCTEAGKKTRTCKNCGKTSSKTIAALGHNYSTEWTIDTAAGCTTAGSKSHHCTRCDAKTDVTEIAKTGHSYGSYKTTKEATCTEDGKQTRTCKNCGKTTSKTIAATGHDYGSYKTTKKATCTEAGKKTRTCKNCGKTSSKTIAALGHNYSTEWTIDTAATCTKAGSKSHHCTRCDAKTDVTTIAKTGHSYSEWKTTKKATCTETGTKKRVCSTCGYESTKTISKTEHTYKTTTTTKATTSKNGTKTTKCTACGKVKSTTTIAKIASVKLSYTSYTYNGSAKKPTVTVTDANGNKLVKDTDYTVKYASGRKNVGKYTVTVTFKGNYSGTKTLTFTIKPKGATISKLTAGTKKFTVKLNELPTQITGYQIQYSTSSKMTSAKTKTYASTTTLSRTISSLKSATKYYVRVRTYKTVDGSKIYSSWSSAKSVKTK